MITSNKFIAVAGVSLVTSDTIADYEPAPSPVHHKVKHVYVKHLHIRFVRPSLEGTGGLLRFHAFFHITLIYICGRPETPTFSLIVVQPNEQ